MVMVAALYTFFFFMLTYLFTAEIVLIIHTEYKFNTFINKRCFDKSRANYLIISRNLLCQTLIPCCYMCIQCSFCLELESGLECGFGVFLLQTGHLTLKVTSLRLPKHQLPITVFSKTTAYCMVTVHYTHS